MADFADLGSAREELDRKLALECRAPAGPTATGVCLCCGEELVDGLRWCDADCRDDWAVRKARGG